MHHRCGAAEERKRGRCGASAGEVKIHGQDPSGRHQKPPSSLRQGADDYSRTSAIHILAIANARIELDRASYAQAGPHRGRGYAGLLATNTGPGGAPDVVGAKPCVTARHGTSRAAGSSRSCAEQLTSYVVSNCGLRLYMRSCST